MIDEERKGSFVNGEGRKGRVNNCGGRKEI